MMKLTARQWHILETLKAQDALSTNQLYVRTSPACIAQGRTRTISTFGWRTPARLKEMGLIDCRVDTTLVTNYARQRPYLSEKSARHAARHLVRYFWFLTPQGEQALQAKAAA